MVVPGRKVVSRPYRPFIVAAAAEELFLALLELAELVVEVMETTQEPEPLVLQTSVVAVAAAEAVVIRTEELEVVASLSSAGTHHKLRSLFHLA